MIRPAVRTGKPGWLSVTLAVCAAGLAWPGLAQTVPSEIQTEVQTEAHSAIPDLSGFWNHNVAAIDYQSPPGGGPGPVRNTRPFTGRNPIWVGNYHNPILQPWAAEAVKKFGELEMAGRGPPTAQMLCMPSGVPNDHTLMGPIEILQTPDIVLILHQRDHQVRRVYMDRQHADGLEPSWYGESIGHYEGDTLVVDTIGLNDRTVTDRNGTPHTEAIHVVERYRVADDGASLEVQFTVEDPGAFTTAWSAMVRYRPIADQEVLAEVVCAENNRDIVTKEMFPIPVDETPDF